VTDLRLRSGQALRASATRRLGGLAFSAAIRARAQRSVAKLPRARSGPFSRLPRASALG